ncbi:hypothetical protein M9Y10_028766 [Tritrichomonas musculus]|uniref:Uncharacterized protein n=1 Tax=Tritrichomonas musculus TaxID=1915356 RepID=A0ABR2KKT5_9EUKA
MAAATEELADPPTQSSTDSPDLTVENDVEPTQDHQNQRSKSSLSQTKAPRIISIIDLDPQKIISIPKINEQESCLAMLRLGVEPEDLVKLSKDSISKIPGTPEMQNKVAAELEKRRVDTIENIKEERQKIINEQNTNHDNDDKKTTRSTSTSTQTDNHHLCNNSLEAHKNRFEKLKKTQLLNIIKEQQQRKLIAMEDINIQHRIDLTKERRQQEIQRKKDQEEEKNRLLSERARQQLEKRQEIAQNQLEKIAQDEERRKTFQDKYQRVNDVKKQQLQQQRNQKLQQIRSQQLQRQIEEKEKAETKLQFVQNRQNLIDKKRAQILSNMQEKARENDKKIETKMQVLKQREEQKRIENEERLKKQTETAQTLVKNGQMIRLNEVAKRRIIEQQKIEAARQRNLSKSAEIVEVKKREICQKQLKAEENIKNISLLRKIRYTEANNKMLQRSISALQTKKEKEEKFRNDHMTIYQQKQEGAKRRADGIRELTIQRIQERASNSFLKQKIGEDKAKRLERMKQYEVLLRAQKAQDKVERISEFKKKQKDDQIKELMELKKKEQFELEQIDKFQKALMNNPDADLFELARTYGIDLSEFNDLIQQQDQNNDEIKNENIISNEMNISNMNSIDDKDDPIQNDLEEGKENEENQQLGELDNTIDDIGHQLMDLPVTS